MCNFPRSTDDACGDTRLLKYDIRVPSSYPVCIIMCVEHKFNSRKSTDDVYIDIMLVHFNTISHPKVEFHSHPKMDKLHKMKKRDYFLFSEKKNSNYITL